jgi:hypothetical protein
MRHRRSRNARRKAGFVATVSARALISQLPMRGSSAQEGMSPHRRRLKWRGESAEVLRTVGASWVGAML